MSKSAWVLVAVIVAILLYELSQQGDDGTGSSTSTLATVPGIQSLEDAIAKFENVAAGDNNPGGVNPVGGGGPIHFATLQQGVDAFGSAIQHVISILPSGATLADFLQKYSGLKTGSAELNNYDSSVEGSLGASGDTPISSIVGGGSGDGDSEDGYDG
jgi:hypothetical protein